MSDRDLPPDPIDAAYAQAEARLDDAEARAARRARLLAAVTPDAEPARAAAAAPAPAPPPARRPSLWRRGGWPAAAGVAGLGLLFAAQLYRPIQHPAPAAPAPAAAPPQAQPASPTPPVTPPPAVREPAPRPLAAAPAAPPPPDVAPRPPPPPPPPPPLPIAALPAPPPPPPPPPGDIVVTAERRASARAANAPAAVGEAAVAPLARPPPPDLAARLRAAAAAGRTGELEVLLGQGAPVDAADADGNTALMDSVQADQPAAAALLRRHGASPDRRNRAGDSARDMAATQDDPALDRALGAAP